MNNSESPIGVNGRKELKITETDTDLFSKWFEDYTKELKESGKYYTVNFMSYDVPRVSLKDKVNAEKDSILGFSEIQNIEGKSIELVQNPLEHMTASKAPSKTQENARAYDKERARAKMQSQAKNQETRGRETNSDEER